MKLGIVITRSDAEAVYNALRLALYSLQQGDKVSVFLSGEGVELDQIQDPKFDVVELAEQVLASGGKFNTPVWQRIFWASLEGLIAIMLLLTGGLAALQAGAVSMGLPFALVLLGVAVALVRQLRIEMRAVDKSVQPRSIGER